MLSKGDKRGTFLSEAELITERYDIVTNTLTQGFWVCENTETIAN